jgi:hypothetical protein
MTAKKRSRSGIWQPWLPEHDLVFSRRTPVVSRDYQLSYLELVEEADSELAKMLTAERCAAREPAVWCLAGARNSGSVTDPLPPGQGIRPLGARVQEGGFRACGVAPAAPA